MAEAPPGSPLAHRDPVAAGQMSTVSISEIPDRGMIDVRIAPDDTDLIAAIEGETGFPLPRRPRTAASSGALTAFWLSIDQWMVACPRDDRSDLVARLNDAARGRHGSVLDLSDARAIIRLEGLGAREIIMKGAAADLTRGDHPVGSVRRVLFAEIAAIVHLVSLAPDIVDLYVFRSYADYAWDWLSAAASPGAELRLFGVQVPPPV